METTTMDRKLSEFTIRLSRRLKKECPLGQCRFKGCYADAVNRQGKKSRKALYCMGHQRLVQREQRAYNNTTWRERQRRGEASHMALRNGEPTRWLREIAEVSPKAAERIVRNVLAKKTVRVLVQRPGTAEAAHA